MVAISHDRQVLPGTLEHTLSDVIDSLDMSIFDDRYKNDHTGAPAYDPRILLKIILFAYSKGVIYSRRIAQLCNENVIFMALSADSSPHFTTIADFISSMEVRDVGVNNFASMIWKTAAEKRRRNTDLKQDELTNPNKES